MAVSATAYGKRASQSHREQGLSRRVGADAANGHYEPPVMARLDPVVETARKFLDDLMPLPKRKCPGGGDQPLEIRGGSNWSLERDMGLGTPRCTKRSARQLALAGT